MASRPTSRASINDTASSTTGSPRAMDRSDTRRSATSDTSSTAGSNAIKMPMLRVNPSKRSTKSDRGTATTSRSGSVYSSTKYGNPSSKRTHRSVDYQPQVTVKDEQGRDVTPVSLLSLKPTVLRQHTALADATAPINRESPHTPPAYMPSETLFDTRSSLSMGRSFFGSDSGRTSGASTPDTVDDDDNRSVSQSPRESAGMPRVQEPPVEYGIIQSQEEPKKRISDSELDATVSLLLEETPTIWLLDLPGSVVEKETPEATEVVAKNKKYDELLKNRVGNENFVSRGMQTFNNALKNKDVQVSAPIYKDAATMATNWDIYDAFLVVEQGRAKGEPEPHPDTTRNDLQRLTEFDQEPGTWVDVDNTDTSYDSIYARQKNEEKAILKSESFADNLKSIERVIAQNLHAEKLLQYRGVDKLQFAKAVHDTLYFDAEDGAPPPPPQQKPLLQFLWKFHAPKITNKPVQCMAWNCANKDMLAVGYGHINTPDEPGLVCVWNLGNVFYPERVLKTSIAVTSVSFSSANVSLLAVGLLDGSIIIYDLRKRQNIPVLQNSEIQHHDPVWDLKWVDRGADRGEALVSASTDGRVLMWDIKKGLEVRSELMRLRRVQGSTAGQTRNEALIARHAGAFSLDFNMLNDPNIYVVGTEDGTIHKCSCSYNEQYLDTYRGHTGSVYKVKWSPFNAGVFLSCSADWTTRIWEQEHEEPKITIESENSAVEDICWSTFRSTMFACATNRLVQLWDIEISTLDPVVSYELKSNVTTVSFSPDCPALVVGDGTGAVSVFRLMHIVPTHEYDQSKALLKALSPDILQ